MFYQGVVSLFKMAHNTDICTTKQQEYEKNNLQTLQQKTRNDNRNRN